MAKRIKKTNFEYLEIDTIDDELKCAICVRPFNLPIYAPQCGHTFCQECIKKWLKKSSSCPTCRSDVKINDYLPVKTRIVLNQLSRLRIKCLLCEQINIEDRDKHENICLKKIISCSSADLKCSWTGKREDLNNHLKICSFTLIRPIIEELKNQLEKIQKIQIEQQCFIQAYINKGHILSSECTATSCTIKNSSRLQNVGSIPCSLCKKQKTYNEIFVHSCITKNCICKSCFHKHTQQLKPVTVKRRVLSSSSDESDVDRHRGNVEEEEEDSIVDDT